LYFPRYTLRRGDSEIIIQGTHHVAPSEVFKFLSEDMDEKEKNGYGIFYEGIDDSVELRENAAKREKEIHEFLNLLWELFPAMAEGLKYSEQDEDLEYPDDAINADAAMSEIVGELYKRRFRCGLLVKILKIALNDKNGNREKIIDSLSKEESDDFWKVFERKLYHIFLWIFMIRKTNPVFLDYRNKKAIDIIEAARAEKNLKKAILYYGSGHISGIASLLKKSGWKVASISKLVLS